MGIDNLFWYSLYVNENHNNEAIISISEKIPMLCTFNVLLII
jgi:hypothetical protein